MPVLIKKKLSSMSYKVDQEKKKSKQTSATSPRTRPRKYAKQKSNCVKK